MKSAAYKVAAAALLFSSAFTTSGLAEPADQTASDEQLLQNLMSGDSSVSGAPSMLEMPTGGLTEAELEAMLQAGGVPNGEAAVQDRATEEVINQTVDTIQNSGGVQ